MGKRKTYGPNILNTKTDPIINLLVFSKYATSSRMSHESGFYFLENPIRHCVSEESSDVDLV